MLTNQTSLNNNVQLYMLRLVKVNYCIMRRQIAKKMCSENAMHLTLVFFTRKTILSPYMEKYSCPVMCFPPFLKLYSEYVKFLKNVMRNHDVKLRRMNKKKVGRGVSFKIVLCCTTVITHVNCS